MKSVMKYICLFLMTIGIGNTAWAAVTFSTESVKFTGTLDNSGYFTEQQTVTITGDFTLSNSYLYDTGGQGYTISETAKQNTYNNTATITITFTATQIVSGSTTLYVGYTPTGGTYTYKEIPVTYAVTDMDCSITPIVSFAEGTIRMPVDDIYTDAVTVTYNGEATGQKIVYTSTNSSVAEAHDGHIYAYAEGETEITATALAGGQYCEASATCTVTVTAATVTYTGYRTHCNEYTLTYDGYTDKYTTSCYGQGTVKYPEGAAVTITSCTPPDLTGEERTFKNWNTKSDGTGNTFASGNQEMISEDLTLYAQWYNQRKVTSDEVISTELDDTNSDIVVKTGAKLTISNIAEINNLVIESGAQVVLQDEAMMSINALRLKGGYNGAANYDMPQLYIHNSSTLYRTNTTAYFDLSVNKNNYYPFAVPFEVKVSDIDYADSELAAVSTYGKHYVIKEYNGATRAAAGSNNWVQVAESTTLKPGTGYIITAIPRSGEEYAVIRIPLDFADNWTYEGEQSEYGGTKRSQVAVTAHNNSGSATKNNTGWNFIANPYMATYDASQLTATSTDVPLYIQVPTYNFSEYTVQVLKENATLPTEWGFFVQVGTTGTFDFGTDGRISRAPMLQAAPKAAANTLYADIYLTNADRTAEDRLGLVVNDRYTTDYEIGADLERMFGEGYTLAAYTVMNGTRLAFNALSTADAQQEIPVGFRAPEAGEYTFAIDPEADMQGIEQVELRDLETGDITNLLTNDYTFSVGARSQCDTRFTVRIVPRKEVPTSISDGISNKVGTRKTIYDGHLYIIRDGKVYNANGAAMK